MPERTVPVVDTSASPYARLRPVGLGDVEITDGFWAPHLEVNRSATLPAEHAQCETTGAIDNFRRVGGTADAPFQGKYYSDSDVYKWLEAAAWALAPGPSGGEVRRRPGSLSSSVDGVVAAIMRAQRADGYVNTYYAHERAGERWTDLAVRHEMYCIGHLVQAGVAHHRATGEKALIDVALAAVGHVEQRFPPGRRHGACGHPCLEMALVELFRTTGDERWLALASWQVESRGRGVLGGQAYLQDHLPVRSQRHAVGHAVRGLYLYAAVADLVLETGEEELGHVADALWEDIASTKTYVTGGIGARWETEAFGDPYELPERAYAETCAGIASIYFAWRQLMRTGDGRYRAAMEMALHNAVLPAVDASGTSFFYVNPLADAGHHRRSTWFATACCPPNIARILATLPGYVWSTSDDGLWLHLLIGCRLRTAGLHGAAVEVDVDTRLPWEASTTLTLRTDRPIETTLRLPDPEWADDTSLLVNGESVPVVRDAGYLAVRRRWQSGDVVRIEARTPVRLLTAHPSVSATHHQVAVTCGPLVYCVEQADHDVPVASLRLGGDEQWEPGADPALPGARVLRTSGRAVSEDRGPLHRPVVLPVKAPPSVPVQMTAVPYFSWANRAAGAMRVFVPLEDRTEGHG